MPRARSMTGPSGPRLLQLDRGETHVWLGEVPPHDEAGLLARWATLLSQQERIQLHRLVFAEHRDQYLAAHLLLRATLSRYATVAPSEWRFARNAYGRPEIAGSQSPWLRFNMSRTKHLVAVAVARTDDVGVDVEHIGRVDPSVDVAERYFAPDEVAQLRQLDATERRGAFFSYWVLKEAYIKARGLGLSLPLDQFAFHLSPTHSPQVSFDPRLNDNDRAWHFALYSPTSCHRLAIALRSGAPLHARLQRVEWASFPNSSSRPLK